MIALTRRSTRPRYAQRGHWRTAETIERRALRILGPSETDTSVGFTGFIGRGGELIDVDNDERGHEYLARKLGTTPFGLEQQGLARFDLDDVGYMGVSFVQPLTPAQMRVILDFSDQIDNGGEVAVDVHALGATPPLDVDRATRQAQERGMVNVFSDRVESPTKARLARLLREANAVAEAAR